MSEGLMVKGMNARQIKIIACVSMLFSHVGIIFWPYTLWWQIPGRIAMPLFAYMIANGARMSRDPKKYLARLIIYALVIQYPYSIFLGLRYLNICFTLSLGLLAILLWQSGLPLLTRVPLVMALGLMAEFCGVEYGIYGVMMIFAAHLFFTDWRSLGLCWLLINLPYLADGAIALLQGEQYPIVQGLCILALPFLRFYNGERGGGSRWEFYIFYIGHMAFLYGLRLILWGY